MPGDVTQYANLITSQHADKPNFMSMVEATCQPGADLVSMYATIPQLYDVDTAVGTQLDVIGQWVGITRNLDVPITDVYFAFDTVGLGFDQGIWLGPFDPVSGLVSLPDDFYRAIIKVRILNNVWNGSKEDAYTLVNNALAAIGYSIFIEDPADLTMKLGLVTTIEPTALAKALLTGGKFNVKPIGVHISDYIYPTGSGPVFAFDVNNSLLAGFDTGKWATFVPN